MSTFKNMPRTYPRKRKCEELSFGNYTKPFILETAQKHGSKLSANVRQCNIAYSVVHVQLCFLNLYLLVHCFFVQHGRRSLVQSIYSSVRFLRIKNNKC